MVKAAHRRLWLIALGTLWLGFCLDAWSDKMQAAVQDAVMLQEKTASLEEALISEGLLIAKPDTGRMPGTDLVFLGDRVLFILNALQSDTVTAFCATAWTVDTQRGVVSLYDIRSAVEQINPTCELSEATVLVRPACVFGPSEYISLPRKTPYVILLCNPTGRPPQGYGIHHRRPVSDGTKITDSQTS